MIASASVPTPQVCMALVKVVLRLLLLEENESPSWESNSGLCESSSSALTIGLLDRYWVRNHQLNTSPYRSGVGLRALNHKQWWCTEQVYSHNYLVFC